MTILAIALSSTSWATPTFYSDPQGLAFWDDASVFDVFEIDTGYIPGGLSPASARFFIAPDGGVTTEAEATSYLAWPDPLQHNVRGEPGTGHFSLDGGIDLQAEVEIDLGFLFRGVIPLWTETITFSDDRDFEPLLLDGSTVRVSSDAEIFPAIEFPLNVVDGLDLLLVVELYPDVESVLEPVGVLTMTEDGTYFEQLGENVSLTLPLPDDPSEIVLQSSYVADITSTMDIVLESRIDLQTFLGPITVFTVPIDIPVVSETERRISEPTVYGHPLPAINALPEVLDFGSVSVGETVELIVDVDNIGLRALGTEAFLGAGDFDVQPQSALIEPGDGGAYTVTFSPMAEGPVTSMLEIESSDPGFPVQSIVLVADAVSADTTSTDPPDTTPGTEDDAGTDPDVPSDNTPPLDGERERSGASACGCASTGSPLGGWVLMWLGVVCSRRRR